MCYGLTEVRRLGDLAFAVRSGHEIPSFFAPNYVKFVVEIMSYI